MNANNNDNHQVLYAHRIGIDTYKQAIVFMRRDCDICRSEGFETRTRIHVAIGNRFIIAILNTVGENLLPRNKIGLSEFAWQLLDAKEGDVVRLSHPAPLDSLSHIHSKIYGNELDSEQMQAIIQDVAINYYVMIMWFDFVTSRKI